MYLTRRAFERGARRFSVASYDTQKFDEETGTQAPITIAPSYAFAFLFRLRLRSNI